VTADVESGVLAERNAASSPHLYSRSDRDHHPLAPANGKIVRRGRNEGLIVSFPAI